MIPAMKNRVPPVHTGDHSPTSHLVPTLFPPQRNTTSSKLEAMEALLGFDTRRVKRRRALLPMKIARIPSGPEQAGFQLPQLRLHHASSPLHHSRFIASANISSINELRWVARNSISAITASGLSIATSPPVSATNKCA